MALILNSMGLQFEQEKRFHHDRKWRFDFAINHFVGVNKMVAIEVEGGTWGKSRHGYGKGFEADCEKYNEAALMGWTVLRYTTGQIKKNPEKIMDDIKRALCQK